MKRTRLQWLTVTLLCVVCLLLASCKDSKRNSDRDLDDEDERHRALYRDIEKRRVDKMSVSVVVKEDSYDRETHTRTILKIKKLYDVSAVDFPAYNDTSISTARDFFSEEHAKEFKELEERRRRQMLIAKTLC